MGKKSKAKRARQLKRMEEKRKLEKIKKEEEAQEQKAKEEFEENDVIEKLKRNEEKEKTSHQKDESQKDENKKDKEKNNNGKEVKSEEKEPNLAKETKLNSKIKSSKDKLNKGAKLGKEAKTNKEIKLGKEKQKNKEEKIKNAEKAIKAIEEEKTKEKEMTPEFEEKANNRIFKNIIISILVLVFCILKILGYSHINSESFLLDLKVFSIGILMFSILLFERSYNKSDSKLLVYGLEGLFISLATLCEVYIFQLYNGYFTVTISIEALILAIYYLTKCIRIYKNTKKQYVNSLSDIKEIVRENKIVKIFANKNEKIKGKEKE